MAWADWQRMWHRDLDQMLCPIPADSWSELGKIKEGSQRRRTDNEENWREMTRERPELPSVLKRVMVEITITKFTWIIQPSGLHPSSSALPSFLYRRTLGKQIERTHRALRGDRPSKDSLVYRGPR